MCSAASFQIPIPPIPTMGILIFLATLETRCESDRFHRWSAVAAMRGFSRHIRGGREGFQVNAHQRIDGVD